jgi:hypothetical protein
MSRIKIPMDVRSWNPTFRNGRERCGTRLLFANISRKQKAHDPGNARDSQSIVQERDLIQAKRPRSHPETIAVLAYHLAESGTAEFSEEDMRRGYIRAGARPPKTIGQALRDANNRYDYVETGRGRGRYRLTAHGDRTVRFDLPRR